MTGERATSLSPADTWRNLQPTSSSRACLMLCPAARIEVTTAACNRCQTWPQSWLLTTVRGRVRGVRFLVAVPPGIHHLLLLFHLRLALLTPARRHCMYHNVHCKSSHKKTAWTALDSYICRLMLCVHHRKLGGCTHKGLQLQEDTIFHWVSTAKNSHPKTECGRSPRENTISGWIPWQWQRHPQPAYQPGARV